MKLSSNFLKGTSTMGLPNKHEYEGKSYAAASKPLMVRGLLAAA